jgi:large subunit ribosomal protein L10
MAKTKRQKLAAKEKLKKHRVSAANKKLLNDLVKLTEKNGTIMLTSTSGIPSAQLQRMRHEIKRKGTLKFVKKNIMIMAVEKAKKEGIAKLKPYISDNLMVMFSSEDAFDIASMLSEYKYPAKAKAGQIADKDITIEAGSTDLLPGPAISELSAVGLKVGVEGGKIAIKAPSTIVKKGEKINKAIAEVLSKLEIMPFITKLNIIAVYDSKSKKIFVGININKEEAVKELVRAFMDAKGLAIKIAYPTAETIRRILANASFEGEAIAKLIKDNV